MRLLLTGATGFVGNYVGRAVEAGEFVANEIVSPPAGWDIRDPAQVASWVAQVRPQMVLHLAAQSFVPRSFEDPRETYDINVLGTLNLLLALKQQRFSGRLVYVSSGDVYGQVPDAALPVNDSLLPEPRSPYASSKVAAEELCLQWRRSDGLDVVIARPFNHIGPGQNERFVLPSIAKQIVAISRGMQPPRIDVGDIDTTRDFTDVRDVVAAYDAIFHKGVSGRKYLIASGQERRVRDILMQMLDIAGVNVEIHEDTTRLRPAEQRRMVADASLLRGETGWTPRIPFTQTVSDLLEYAKSTT
ncbi:MAG: NAD-dependent epimerase/dehydratase family protein [Chitinophagaceae bacterium]|nr:MAG: NAD-dependent epimerase/dehydratase family protein [Chitinophagaceae bacterium]